MSEKKRAIVVGSSGGIGPEIARRLDRQGYELTLVDRDLLAIQTLAEQLSRATAVAADLCDREALAELCAKIEGDADGYDVAVMNAGVIFPKLVQDTDPGELDLELEVNLRSAIHLLRAFTRHMLPRKRGHIITTVSMGGIIALKGSACYAATKFGLRGFVVSLHNELRANGINVSGIYPSGVDTPMLQYEARNDGSALNFASALQSVADIGDAFERALATGKVEIYPSWMDSLSGRLVGSFPWLIPRVLPLMERIGERGRQRYLARLEQRSQP